MATVSVRVTIHENGIMNKLNQLGQDSVTMLEIHNLLAKMCDPYVPFLNGPLSQTVEVEPNCVRYVQPYARYQYYGIDFNHTLDFHPLASAMWDKAMLRDHGEEFVQQVKEILIRRAGDFYG